MSGEIQQKNKLLLVHSSAGDNPADFRVNFHEPVIFPEHAQVRLINCRLNLDDNEIIINDSNNKFQWGLGYCWSNVPASGGASSGAPLFTATIAEGEYVPLKGAGDQFITSAIETALNNSVSNMSYLRGGFDVDVAAGKLVVKLSKCVVPTTVNASPTSSNWDRMTQDFTASDLPANAGIATMAPSPQLNDFAGAGGYNGTVFPLRRRDTTEMGENFWSAYISSSVVSGCSNNDGAVAMFFAQFDLANVEAPGTDGDFTEFGLTPTILTNRGINYIGEEPDDYEDFSNLLTGDFDVNGMIGFRYEKDTRLLKIFERNTVIPQNGVRFDDRVLDQNSATNLIHTVDLSTVMADKLDINVFLLEPTGIPVPMGNSPQYQYRVEITLNSGAALPSGGNYGATRDIPVGMYDWVNFINGARPVNDKHLMLPSALSAYVITQGFVSQNADVLFISCAFDNGLNAVKRNIDPANLPLIMFGEPLSALVYQEVATTFAPFGKSFPQVYSKHQTVGRQLGFNNDEFSRTANAVAWAVGLTFPETISTSRSDQATYYLVMDDLPVNNYTGGKSQGKPNKIVGLITLKTRADDLYYPSENKTEVYVDLHNPSPLQYNNLSFRIVDKELRTVKDIYNYTIMTLEVRQNPNVALREMFKGLAQELRVDKRADFKSAGTGIRINSMGQ